MNKVNGWLTFLPILAGQIIALLGMYSTPYIIGISVDHYGLDLEKAGWIGTSEMLTLAVAGILTSKYLSHISALKLALLSTLIIFVSNVGSIFAETGTTLGLLRVCAGIGSGILYTIVTSLIAKTDNPVSTFARIYFWMSLVFAVYLYVVPLFQADFGSICVFMMISSMIVMLSGLIFKIPNTEIIDQSVVASTPLDVPLLKTFLIATTLFFLMYGGIYAFSERVAVALSLTPNEVGLALGLSTVFGLISSFIASKVGLRFGRVRTMIVLLSTAALAFTLILAGGSKYSFISGMIVYGLFSLMFNSLYYGAASSVDKSGRMATIVVTYSVIPYSLGSLLIGTLASHFSYEFVAFPAVVLTMMTLFTILPILKRLDRNEIEVEG